MTQRTYFSRVLPSAVFALLCAWPLLGCNSAEDTTRTGSESHFVRCDDDRPCTVGTCEAGYCELNGRRLTQEEARETPAEPEPSRQEPDGGAPAPGPSVATPSSDGGSGGASPAAPGGGGGAPTGQAGTGEAGRGGASTAGAVPLAFRVVNETSGVIFLDGTQPVGCGALGPDASCWYTAAGLCMADCSAVAMASQCAVDCEPQTPFALRLQPGQEQLLPWDGTFVTRNETHCSDGDCYDSELIDDGSHVASVTAYADVACQVEPCVAIVDGINEGYQTTGSYRQVQVEFALPVAEEEILIVVREDAVSCPPALEACCGDGVVSGGETCDDGNRADGDACDANCGQGGAGAGGSTGTAGAGAGGASSTIVTCGDATCAAGEYCRAPCSGDGEGDPTAQPQCTPLPAGCEEDPSCDCVCGGFTLFCTPGDEAIQCGCA